MKMKNVAVACALMAGMAFTASSAYAAKNVEPTNGKIHFTGSLVNSACGLAPESSPVQVNFGEIPTSQLKDNQRAGVKHAKIVLQGCDTTVAKTATVTYTPATIDSDNNALAAFTSGTAKGAGIGMVDSGNQTWNGAKPPLRSTLPMAKPTLISSLTCRQTTHLQR